jgi:hypothetical protein
MLHTMVKTEIIKDHQYLLNLTTPGSIFHGLELDTKMLIVASKGELNDWAVYIGQYHSDTGWQTDYIKSYGLKLPYRAAQEIFPEIFQIEGAYYRD